jgi:hypothetical protein
MKNIIIAFLCVIIVLMGFAAMIEKKEQKEKRERETAPQMDKNVYIDHMRCLHTDKYCIMLFENYAVKIEKKNDPELSHKYDYVCMECYDAEHMKYAEKRVEY